MRSNTVAQDLSHRSPLRAHEWDPLPRPEPVQPVPGALLSHPPLPPIAAPMLSHPPRTDRQLRHVLPPMSVASVPVPGLHPVDAVAVMMPPLAAATGHLLHGFPSFPTPVSFSSSSVAPPLSHGLSSAATTVAAAAAESAFAPISRPAFAINTPTTATSSSTSKPQPTATSTSTDSGEAESKAEAPSCAICLETLEEVSDCDLLSLCLPFAVF